LVLTCDEQGEERALSNVCTHRANLVVKAAGSRRELVCGYHGRRFGLDGSLRAMPGFKGAEAFPGPCDDLPRIVLERWGPLRFVSLAPFAPLGELLAPLTERLAGFPIGDLVPDPSATRTYQVKANWALYCDNYLEGFHIPFVHPALRRELEIGDYRTDLFPYTSLQTGISPRGEEAFEDRVAAYYFWVFPNLMLNFYPWGLSVNVVEPVGPGRTRVHFLTYVSDPDRRGKGAGGDLDTVEMEDEAVVEAVQRGVSSGLYERGRFSPDRERGVHHFHRLLARFLEEGPPRPVEG
jgi:choline monooxygenase